MTESRYLDLVERLESHFSTQTDLPNDVKQATEVIRLLVEQNDTLLIAIESAARTFSAISNCPVEGCEECSISARFAEEDARAAIDKVSREAAE